MDGFDLHSALYELFEDTDALIAQIPEAKEKWAVANKSYKVKKRRAILYERANGQPATLTQDLARGREDISSAAFERDCADGEYDGLREAIMHNKIKERFYMDEISRQWGRAGRQ